MPQMPIYDPAKYTTEQDYLDDLDQYAEYLDSFEDAKWDLLDTQTWIWD